LLKSVRDFGTLQRKLIPEKKKNNRLFVKNSRLKSLLIWPEPLVKDDITLVVFNTEKQIKSEP